MSKNPRLLLGGYATGSLNRSERQELMDAALEDQEIFNELLEIEPLRSAFADPEFRSQIKADLRNRVESQGVPTIERLRRLLFSPGVIPVFSVAFTLLLVVLVRQGYLHENSPVVQVALGPAGGPLVRAAGLLNSPESDSRLLQDVRSQPVERPAAGGIGFDRAGNVPSYGVGDPIRIGFKVLQDSSVLVVEERPDGSLTRLFPNRFQSSPQVEAGQTIRVPPAGQGPLQVDGPAGKRVIRVLVFPPGVDPLTANESWDKLRAEASVLEKTYEVRP